MNLLKKIPPDFYLKFPNIDRKLLNEAFSFCFVNGFTEGCLISNKENKL